MQGEPCNSLAARWSLSKAITKERAFIKKGKEFMMENNSSMGEGTPNGLTAAMGTTSPLAKKQARKAYSLLGITLFILMAAQQIFPIFFMPVLTKLIPSISGTLAGMLSAYIAMYIIALPLCMLFVKRLPTVENQPAEAGNKGLNLKLVLLMYPFGYALMALVGMGANLFQTYVIGRNGTVAVSTIIADDKYAWVRIILGVLIAPAMEEIIFRLLPFKKASGFGMAPYVAWSAIVFGLFHLNFGQSLYAAALGAFLAMTMYKTRNVLNSILVHVLINFSAGIGIGGVLMKSTSEVVKNGYTIFSVAMIPIGLICGFIIFKKKMLANCDVPAPQNKVKARVAFLNVGTIVYVLISLAITVAMFFLLQ